ncbi:hypothetical protein ESCOCP322M1_23465 [Escherichia coli]
MAIFIIHGIYDIYSISVFIYTRHIAHPSCHAQRKVRPVSTLCQMLTDWIQHTLRQLLATVHGDLPGAVAQGRIAEALDQQVRIGLQIGALRHSERRGLFAQHQRQRRIAIIRVSHGFGDGLIAAQIT